jgi:thiamine pyrophosphate-dependent acetolactate synthase large subunit-like protein
MTDLSGGHLVARTLRQAGVGHVFTLCGGHILPIYDGCLAEGVQIVDMRHEQACAHAGDAYARLTRNLGVAIVTAGPGVTDAVTGAQLSFFGAERAVATSLPFTRYDRMVEALGGTGLHVTDPAALRPALERALGAGGVACVNVELDPAAYHRTGQVSMAI